MAALPSPPVSLEERHVPPPHPTALGSLMAAPPHCCMRKEQSESHPPIRNCFARLEITKSGTPVLQGGKQSCPLCVCNRMGRFASGVGGGQRQPLVPLSHVLPVRGNKYLMYCSTICWFLQTGHAGISPQGGKERKGFASAFREVQGPLCFPLHGRFLKIFLLVKELRYL